MPTSANTPDLGEILARLTAIADSAPIGVLGLDSRTHGRATTLGYNHIGHIRLATAPQLLADFGPDGMHEIVRALRANGLDFGLPTGAAPFADSGPTPLTKPLARVASAQTTVMPAQPASPRLF